MTESEHFFDLNSVRLQAGVFYDAQERNRAYLHFLEPDRLLHNFRLNAGLEPKAEIYGGWETRGIGGQTLGHYLSATAMMVQGTGDAELKRKLDYCVEELALCQSQNPHGYTSGIPNGQTLWEEIERGDVRASGFDLNGAWVPWYTLHKLYAGLRDAYCLAGNEQAKQVLIHLSEWALYVTQNLDDAKFQEMLRCEHGGMNEVLADVYLLTGDQRFLQLAKKFCHQALLIPLSEGRDELNGWHANTQIPKVIGFARLYELTGEEHFARAARFFWNTVTQERTFVIGGNSDREHFFDPTHTDKHLSPATAETCNTYNMLKLTRHLYQWEQLPEYIDFAERALFNHILGSIDPVDGGFCYFNPLQAGHFKVYSHPTDSFWCCVGTGIENHTKYGELIYSRDATALSLHLFIGSTVSWAEKGVTLIQETSFPDRDQVRLTIRVAESTSFILRIRHPYWTENLEITINGQPHSVASKPGEYESIERLWQDGDTVELTIPSMVRMETAANAPHLQAIVAGPIVLAGYLGTEGLEGQSDTVADQTVYFHYPRPASPVVILEEGDTLLSNIECIDSPNTGYQIRATDSATGEEHIIPLLPYFRAHHHRYGVYWNVYDTAQWNEHQAQIAQEEAIQADLTARTLDEYRPGEQQSEVDHGLEQSKSNTGTLDGVKWRDAVDGGYFAITMQVLPNQPADLRVRYWGGDRGRHFHIAVDEQIIAQQSLEAQHPNEFWEVTYPLPAEVTQGKSRVTIAFVPKPGSHAGGIYGVRVLRRGAE